MSLHRSSFTIAIIGCGHVGMTTAYALLLSGLPTKLILFARDAQKAEGEKLDMEHALPFLPDVEIVATNDFADLAKSDLVIFTAGAAQKPGETRLDLIKTNKEIVKDNIPKIIEHAPNAVIIMVTNPVDVLTHYANQIVDVRPGQIFGSGTLLDTARFRYHLSEFLDVNPRSLHTYILGEHGDSSFPALSSASIGGQKLIDLPGFSLEKAQESYQKARDAAYQVIAGKGATYYAIGTVLTHMARAIQRDERTVMPVSHPLQNYYGVSDVSLSVPCIVGRSGIKKVLTIELDAQEQMSLLHSAEVLKKLL